MRAPPFRIVEVSRACISPSSVRSMTKSQSASALTAASCPVSARQVPVERTIGPSTAAGVGTLRWKKRTPMRPSASSARSTLSARLCVSDRMIAVSPEPTLHRSNTARKASIQCASIRSSIMRSSLGTAASSGIDPDITSKII